MDIIEEQRNQGEEQGGENSDPALRSNPGLDLCQPIPWMQASTIELSRQPWNHGEVQPGVGAAGGLGGASGVYKAVQVVQIHRQWRSRCAGAVIWVV